MNWRGCAFWLFAVLAMAGGAMICWLNFRYYILDEMTAGLFLKTFWLPLLLSFAWTLLCGATAIWIEEDNPRGYTPL